MDTLGSGGAAGCVTAPCRSEFQQDLLALYVIGGQGYFPERSCTPAGVKIFDFREHTSEKEGMVKGGQQESEHVKRGKSSTYYRMMQENRW